MTRALLKAAKWVEENPTAAANLAVEKKYIASSAEINAQAIGKLQLHAGRVAVPQEHRPGGAGDEDGRAAQAIDRPGGAGQDGPGSTWTA